MPLESTEQRKLAAIMFTDMVGYSGLAQGDEKLALELLEEHRALLRSIFPIDGGPSRRAMAHCRRQGARCAHPHYLPTACVAALAHQPAPSLPPR